MLGQHLDGDRAVQAGVGRLVDLAHAAGAEGGTDLVRAERGAEFERMNCQRTGLGVQREDSSDTTATRERSYSD